MAQIGLALSVVWRRLGCGGYSTLNSLTSSYESILVNQVILELESVETGYI